MEKQQTLKEKCGVFWNRHKKKVIVTASAVVVVAGGCILAKNRDDILNTLENLVGTPKLQTALEESINVVTETATESLAEITIATKESFVPLHKMNLPEWKNASPTAVARAQELGIELAPHQTLRGPLVRNIAA